MPLFEYSCQACNEQFELLVLGAQKPLCPSCGSDRLEKRLSLPAVKSDTTRDLALRAARRRDAKIGEDRVQAQIQYEQNHD